MFKIDRNAHCGELRLADVGKKVSLCGWVQRRRNLGALIFVALRDRSGIVQCVFNEEVDKALADRAFELRSEFTVRIAGTVTERVGDMKNPKMPTGDVEVVASELEIYARAETPPFEIVEGSDVNEALRLKYRYLDLRRPELQRAIALRHGVTMATREFFSGEGFYEIETPMLSKSTPEGARDYLVPSRIHPGKFFSLPQSPQQYKQLLMIAGFDRYFQIARCMRDEDLRVDRQPEFTQIDVEMSFVDRDDVLDITEKYISFLFKKVLGKDVELPLQRLPYDEAILKYGSDKPDLRFGLEIHDISSAVRGCGFSVFDSALDAGGEVRCICVPGWAGVPRKELDALTAFVRTYRAGGLAWLKKGEATTASFAKFVSAETLEAIASAAGADDGALVLIVADAKTKIVADALGALRCECARRRGLIDPSVFRLLWVVDFPMFEFSEEENRWVATHHPFTMPYESDLPELESNPGAVKAKAYDIVLNGFELGGGSIRIHDSALQDRMFRALGLNEETIKLRFGSFIEAFKYGAPPHGGFALGLDRLCMLLGGYTNIRDVIAFPKVQNASDLMMNAPDTVEQKQLDELHIRLAGDAEE